jgi:AraC-like DNA-binding protein
MNYRCTALKQDITIHNIYTVHYFEFASNYIFEGEKHGFWEFLYVDKGEVDVMADSQGFRLKQGEMIFHKPDEFHNVWANGRVAPNLVVISFECRSKAMSYFEDKIMQIGDTEKDLLAGVLREAKSAFTNPLDDSYMYKLKRKQNQPFGCEQLLRLYLEQLLISLVRRESSVQAESRLSKTTRERFQKDLEKKVTVYLSSHIHGNISFDDVCRFSGMGRTNLKTLFKERTGMGVMEYYRSLKHEEAKTLIREGQLNFTEIADKLSYASIHNFSRHFKRVTGMTPSQYALSVKVKAE